MHDAARLIKRIAMDAVRESSPAGIVYGQVVSALPLKIYVNQKTTLSEEFLVLTRNVMDYEVEMTVEHETEPESDHRHRYAGRKIYKVHNGLTEGDIVIMLQTQGGQSFIVLDKAGE